MKNPIFFMIHYYKRVEIGMNVNDASKHENDTVGHKVAKTKYYKF